MAYLRCIHRHQHVFWYVGICLPGRARLHEPGVWFHDRSRVLGFEPGRGLPEWPFDWQQHLGGHVELRLHGGSGYKNLVYYFPNVVGDLGLGQRHGLPVRPLDRRNTFTPPRISPPARDRLTDVVESYPTVIGISASASDTAYLYGPSTGSNSFVARPTQSYMQGRG